MLYSTNPSFLQSDILNFGGPRICIPSNWSERLVVSSPTEVKAMVIFPFLYIISCLGTSLDSVSMSPVLSPKQQNLVLQSPWKVFLF
jgi:hypothetical protein